jgi:hypothetical protein
VQRHEAGARADVGDHGARPEGERGDDQVGPAVAIEALLLGAQRRRIDRLAAGGRRGLAAAGAGGDRRDGHDAGEEDCTAHGRQPYQTGTVRGGRC